MEYSAKLEEHVPGASGIDFLTQSRCILKIRASDDGNVFNPSDASDVYNPAEDARCTDHLDLSTGIVTIRSSLSPSLTLTTRQSLLSLASPSAKVPPVPPLSMISWWTNFRGGCRHFRKQPHY